MGEDTCRYLNFIPLSRTRAREYGFAYDQQKGLKLLGRMVEQRIGWTRAPPGWLKLNTDGAASKNDEVGFRGPPLLFQYLLLSHFFTLTFSILKCSNYPLARLKHKKQIFFSKDCANVHYQFYLFFFLFTFTITLFYFYVNKN